MEYKHKRSAWFLFFAGCAFIVYFLVESMIIGFSFSSLMWCWAVGGGICVLLSLVIFRYGKIPLPSWLLKILIVIFAVVLLVFIIIEGFIIAHMGVKGEDGLDYIIVLGAHVNNKGMPTKPLYWRIDAAEKYLKRNPKTMAVLSGGKGANEPISEAECMQKELLRRGISKERLILEDKATDTNENIRFSFEKIPSGATVGVVSNNFHVYRAMRIAEKISGRKVSGISAEYKDALLIHYMARESVGIFVDIVGGNMNLF